MPPWRISLPSSSTCHLTLHRKYICIVRFFWCTGTKHAPLPSRCTPTVRRINTADSRSCSSINSFSKSRLTDTSVPCDPIHCVPYSNSVTQDRTLLGRTVNIAASGDWNDNLEGSTKMPAVATSTTPTLILICR
jgi:hypothetical protein